MKGKLKIVVLERGWVVIGYLTFDKENDRFVLEKGSVIRRWGTERGLGQIAFEGSRNETVLDPIPTTNFNKRHIIMEIDCNEENWGTTLDDVRKDYKEPK